MRLCKSPGSEVIKALNGEAGSTLAMYSNGQLTINATANDSEFSGNISGNGSVAKDGAHTFTLSGDNTGFTGAISINGNGPLVFNNSVAYTLSGAVSGMGTLVKQNDTELGLSGNN